MNRHKRAGRVSAARIIQAFSRQPRDEVDLARLTDGPVKVVQDTLQPAQVSLSLGDRPRRRSSPRYPLPVCPMTPRSGMISMKL